MYLRSWNELDLVLFMWLTWFRLLVSIVYFALTRENKEKQGAKFNDIHDGLAHNLGGEFTGVHFIFIAHY